MKGIDVSKYQKSIDLTPAPSAGYEFAIVRTGDGKKKDGYTSSLLNKATAAGMLTGIYHFSRAKTLQAAIDEADFMAQYIEGYEHPMGIYLDMETYKDKSLNTNIYLRWCERMRTNFGSIPIGLYTGEYMFNNYFNKPLIATNGRLWIAKYSNRMPVVGHPLFMWQYSSSKCPDFYYKALDQNIVIDVQFSVPSPPPNDGNDSDKVVLDIINNVYGTGESRKSALIRAGFDPFHVQNLVNWYIKIARETISGKYGNGDTRVMNYNKIGANPDIAQKVVNWMYHK